MDAREAALLVRLQWIVDLRWLAATGLIALSIISGRVLGYAIGLAGLVSLGLLIAAYNVALRFWVEGLRRGAGKSPGGGVGLCANAQIAVDLIALAAVVHLTGGAESPLVLFFVFHMIIAGMILSPQAAYAQAACAMVLYAAVIYLEAQGALPHYHLGIGARPDMHKSAEVWPTFAVLTTTVFVVIYLASTVAGELRRREEQLGRLTRELAGRADACRVAFGELQHTQHNQVQYMRRIAHELKSPLSAISMMLQAILESDPDHVSGKQTEMMQRASGRCQSALDLTDDLLTLSQLKEDLPAEEIAEVSVSHLVENALDEESVQAEHHGVSFDIDIEDPLPLIRGYRDELIGMLRNLISNAAKFSPEGGVVIVRTRLEGGDIVLEVADHGIGIAEEELPRIFDEFYRTSASRKAGINGTGLGLPIVKSVVDHHHGQVTVQSAPEQGTVFTVRLPVALQSRPPEPGEEPR